ncbi:MAG: type II toxin-antitoxin system Phd/YefM family antitoxin [Roseiarcus sp.]|jgi:prevent-host-death family protein
MKSFPASDLKARLGDMFMAAAREPVQITKRGKEAYVLMSEEQYRRFVAMEDAVWAEKARAAAQGGFLGVEETERTLNELVSAKSG